MSPSLEPMQAGEAAYEIKFPLHKAVAQQVKAWARTHMLPDPHGAGEHADCYEIASLYLDTPGLDVFLGTRQIGNSKYRVRRYGAAQSVFLERKQKREAVVRKWRTAVDIAELDLLVPTNLAPANVDETWAAQWYLQRLLQRKLQPVCEVRYARTARVGASPQGTIRLTIDENVRALPQNALRFDATSAPSALSDIPVILELKYKQEMPSVFKRLVQEFRLQARPVSKYKLAVVALGLGGGLIPEAVLRSHSEQCACRIS